MSTQINFKKGSVEMLLLHVLSCKGDCYGYQLSQLIKKSSENCRFVKHMLHHQVRNHLKQFEEISIPAGA